LFILDSESGVAIRHITHLEGDRITALAGVHNGILFVERISEGPNGNNVCGTHIDSVDLTDSTIREVASGFAASISHVGDLAYANCSSQLVVRNLSNASERRWPLPAHGVLTSTTWAPDGHTLALELGELRGQERPVVPPSHIVLFSPDKDASIGDARQVPAPGTSDVSEGTLGQPTWIDNDTLAMAYGLHSMGGRVPGALTEVVLVSARTGTVSRGAQLPLSHGTSSISRNSDRGEIALVALEGDIVVWTPRSDPRYLGVKHYVAVLWDSAS
jgi:hypothetical protein